MTRWPAIWRSVIGGSAADAAAGVGVGLAGVPGCTDGVPGVPGCAAGAPGEVRSWDAAPPAAAFVAQATAIAAIAIMPPVRIQSLGIRKGAAFQRASRRPALVFRRHPGGRLRPVTAPHVEERSCPPRAGDVSVTSDNATSETLRTRLAPPGSCHLRFLPLRHALIDTHLAIKQTLRMTPGMPLLV